MATIGQPLVQPEEGWKRYDDTHPAFNRTGTWSTDNNSAHYGGSARFSRSMTEKLEFDFTGSRLRFMAASAPSQSAQVEITIDGVPEMFSAYKSNVQYQSFLYEKKNLTEGRHKVAVKSLTQADWQLDSLDIDSTGHLLHPDEVTDIKDLDIGKRIRCHYQATTANTVGTFSNLGQETSDFIPVTSSNVPNGDFYFICVDDENKKKKLIADRNIQHSISWDTLNSAGIASGSGVPVNWIDNSRYNTAIRLLTGGISNTDKDNEWEKYIVSSTLNGSIVAGDNNVWNWSGRYSWTSTTTASENRAVRGTSISGFTQGVSNGISAFRPVLIIEDTLKTHTFIKSNNQYKTFKNNQWNNISTILPSQSAFISDGMQNLAVLDRKETKFKQNMINNGVLGESKVFKSSVDLKKLFEIRKIEIE